MDLTQPGHLDALYLNLLPGGPPVSSAPSCHLPLLPCLFIHLSASVPAVMSHLPYPGNPPDHLPVQAIYRPIQHIPQSKSRILLFSYPNHPSAPETAVGQALSGRTNVEFVHILLYWYWC